MYHTLGVDDKPNTPHANAVKRYIRKENVQKIGEQGNSNYNPSYIAENYLPQNMESIPKIVNKFRPESRYISSDPIIGSGEVNQKYIDFLSGPIMTSGTPSCGMGGCELSTRRDESEEMMKKIFPKNDLTQCPFGVKNIYIIFSNYYEGLIFTKIKNINNFSLYAASIQSGLGKGFRYVILTVPIDGTVDGFRVGIDSLMWVSLQTRFIEDDYGLTKQAFNPKVIKGMESEITVTSRDEKMTYYESAEYPVMISLLNVNKSRDYSNKGSIRIALETYQTVVTLKCS